MPGSKKKTGQYSHWNFAGVKPRSGAGCKERRKPRWCKIRWKVSSGVPVKEKEEVTGGEAILTPGGEEADWPHQPTPTPFQSHTLPTLLLLHFLLLSYRYTFSCITPFTTVVLFSLQFPFIVQSGNITSCWLMTEFCNNNNKQTSTLECCHTFAGILNVKWRRAYVLSEAWLHLSQDDLMASVQSWGECWH